MYRIYNQIELDALDTATKLLEDNRITLCEYHKIMDLINNGDYMKFINSLELSCEDIIKNIGGIESMEDKFIFNGVKMTDEKKSYGKITKSDFEKEWENFLAKNETQKILSDFKNSIDKLCETGNIHKLNAIQNPFMDALVDRFMKSFKENHQTPEVDMSQMQSRLDLPLCPRRNNGDFNYDYSEWKNNRKEICSKCNVFCPERELNIKEDGAIYEGDKITNKYAESNLLSSHYPLGYIPQAILDNRNEQMGSQLNGLTIDPVELSKQVPKSANTQFADVHNDFDDTSINDVYIAGPEDCLYNYADIMRMLLNLSDIQIPRQKLMSMDDLELENYAYQIAKNNDSFKFKYDKIREIMSDVVQKRAKELEEM